MEIINQIIQNVIAQFDITYCIVVNILTYFLVSCFINIAGGNITKVMKRVLLIVSIVVVGVLYYAIDGIELRVLINSSVLAPLSWSWVLKPILKKIGYDYKDIDDILNN